MTCVRGNQGAAIVAIGDSPDYVTNGRMFEFTSESLKKTVKTFDTSGITGERQRRVETLARGDIDVAGTINLYVSPGEFEYWLPVILGGGAKVANTFALGDALPKFGILLDRAASGGGTGIFDAQGCRINKATIKGSQGAPISMELDIIGITQTFDSAAWPAGKTLPTGEDYEPYVFGDTSLDYASILPSFKSFELVIDNKLTAERENANTIDDTCSDDLEITLKTDMKWDDVSAPGYDDPSALAITLLLSHVTTGSNTVFTSFTTAGGIEVLDSPSIQNKGRIPWPNVTEWRKNGSTDAISVANVLIP